MTRHFGITNGRPAAETTRRSSAARADTPREEPRFSVYPLPPKSIIPDPLTDSERSRIVGRAGIAFLSLCFLIPMILAGAMLHFR